MTNIIGEVGTTIVENADEGMVKTTVLEDGAAMGTLTIDTKIKIEGEVKVKEKGSLQIIEEEVEIIFLESSEDNGMVTTWVTVTEIIGTKIMTTRIIATEVGDGIVIEGKVIVIEDGAEDGIPIPNTLNKTTHNNTHNRIIIGPLQWVINTNTKCPRTSTQPTHNRNNITCRNHLHNRIKQ